MAKTKIEFQQFREAAGKEHEKFVDQIHELMLAKDCKCEIKEAKNGYVVSYIHKPTKKTVANYVFRKKGPLMRIYGDHAANYMNIMEDWPDVMKKAVIKAGACRRMLNPKACNAKCPMGYHFTLDGEEQKKCRYNCFMFFLGEEANPHLKEMLKKELQYREQDVL